jgi:hypothetical protein
VNLGDFSHRHSGQEQVVNAVGALAVGLHRAVIVGDDLVGGTLKPTN